MKIKTMEKLPTEIMAMILDLLDYKSQIRLIFASKTNKYLIKYWTITERTDVNKNILKWPYYDNLINIYVYELLKVYPKRLRYLTFSRYFNEPINKDSIPTTVTHIKFGDFFNQSVNKLPSSIESIKFGSCFNQSVDKLPSGARSVRQNLVFSENEIRRKPSSIKSIEFDGSFNQTVDKLPSGARSYWRNPFFTKTDFPITIIH